MSISHAVIAVSSSTPTLLTIAGAESANSLSVQVQNLGTGAIYIGGADVSSSSYGASLTPGSFISVDKLSPKDELYAIAQVNGESVAVLRVSR